MDYEGEEVLLYTYTLAKKLLYRHKVEKKYQHHEITCKICAQKINMSILKEHTSLCRRRFEQENIDKDLDQKLNGIQHQAFLKSTNLHMEITKDT